jgi:hypothetical protein
MDIELERDDKFVFFKITLGLFAAVFVALFSNFMSSANADLAVIKNKIDALQLKCAELIAQISLLNPGGNLKNGLIAFYPFNGNAKDESGNNINGIISGAVATTNRNEVNNTAYLFKTASIYMPFNSKMVSTNLTTSTWIKPYSYNPDNYSIIINRFEQGYNNPGGEAWQVILTNNEIWLQILGAGTSPNLNYTILKAPKTIPLNQWSLITCTYDGKIMKIYVNGVELISQPTSTIINTIGTSGISIGVSRQANGIFHYFDGKIDDVGLWNRALTPDEINYLYTDGKIN